jgi:hypothetical protein
MRRKKYKYFTSMQLFSGIILIAIVAAGATYGVIYFLNSRSPTIIPASIKQHIAFQVLAPNISSGVWTVPENLVSYNKSQGVLSLTAVSSSNKMVLSEQPTPQIFTNIPQYYPTLVSGMRSYAQLQVGLGTLYLTHPKGLGGTQTAVMNTSGTLLFIRPLHNMSASEWQSFFNNLIVIRQA